MKNKNKMSNMTDINTTNGNPDTAFDMDNRYTNNTYPAIAQGFNKKIIKSDRQNPRKGTEKW